MLKPQAGLFPRSFDIEAKDELFLNRITGMSVIFITTGIFFSKSRLGARPASVPMLPVNVDSNV